MKIRDRKLMTATVFLLTGTAVIADSTPVLVDAAYRNKHWMTVYTNTVPLTWDWNTNAARFRRHSANRKRRFVIAAERSNVSVASVPHSRLISPIK